MNQIKLKIEEIGLSQREISKRLGKNASYLAGVFRTGLSTAKQAELLELLDIVGGGGTVQSDDQIIAELSQKLTRTEDKYLETHKIKERQAFKIDDQDKIIADLSWRLNCCQDGNNQLRAESDKYFNELNEAQNAGIKALEGYGIARQQLTETQKYLMVANQNCELFETKYRKIALLNWALCTALVAVLILWVLA